MATSSKKPRGKAADIPDPFATPPQQQELTPAAVSPVADAARMAIATINTNLAEFDTVEAGIADLERTYAGVVFAVATPKGMREACEARATINKPIHATEHARKAAKAPVLELGRNIDARAKAIDTRLRALVDPVDDQIKAQERAETARIAAHERNVREIRETPAQCIGKTAAQLQEVLDGLNTLPLETFQEYREGAAKAQFDATQQVQHLLTQAKQAEELAELQRQQKAEAERKEAIQFRIDTMTDQLDLAAMCRTSTRLQELITRLERVVIDEAYQEFAPAAREEKARVMAELVRLRDEKKAAEDARAAAAAAPAPTPAPAPAPTAAPAPVGHAQYASDHDRINDDAAQRLHREFDTFSVGGPVGRSLASDFRRVMTGPITPAPAPATTELSISAPQRPTDAEILSVVADHYEVDAATAAAWLKTIDAAAALAQLSLLPTT